MSFKAIILLTRAEGATHEQFADWWLKQHAPLAKQLPNLRKGVFNLVENQQVKRRLLKPKTQLTN
jgi:hypothetical protein